MELNHLDAVHVRGGQLAEVDQQHGTDGEVGRHHGVGARSGEALLDVGHVRLRQTGRPDNGVTRCWA